MSPSDSALPVVVRAAIVLLPRRFRRDHASAIADLYRRRRDASAERPDHRLRLAFSTTLDLLRTGLAERLASSYHASSLTAPSPSRSPWRTAMMTSLLHDLRLSVRAALRRPGWSLLVVLTLGLGIGTSTAIFTVVHGALLRPLPYAQSEDLLRIYGRFDPESGFRPFRSCSNE
jgi:hypothetical protein